MMTISDIAAIIQRQIETAPAGTPPASVAAHAAGNLAQVMVFDAPTPESALFDAVRAAGAVVLLLWEQDRPGSIAALGAWAADRGLAVEFSVSEGLERHEVRFGTCMHTITVYRRAS